MKRLIVVGGGISGLAAAQGAVDVTGSEALDVLVLEREPRVGGKAVTVRDDGWLVEAGPTGYLDGEPAMDRLVRAAGMEGELVPANRAAANRYLVRGGRMRKVDPNPLRFVRSGLLGPLGLLRLLAEPLVPGKRDDRDESVWQFAARRVGRQAADRLISPMVLGVFAGDARRLSLPAAFPRLAEIEREHGSLVRGMFARRRKKGTGGPTGPAGHLTSFRGGLQALPESLARHGRFRVRCDATVVAVEPATEGGWRVRVSGDGEALAADALVLTGEPWAMAPVIRPVCATLAESLDGIYCPPLVVVALGLGPEEGDRVPRGFGVLIPRGEGFRILGCLWDSYLFDGRSPREKILVRAMLGGAVDPEANDLSEEELVDVVRRDLGRLMGIRGEPVFRRIVKWPRAIPQYEMGHVQRVAAIEGQASERAGLFLAGNALHGIAFAKAAASGIRTGERAARWLLERGTGPR